VNIGIKDSSAERFLVFLSAHSLAISDKWLENGIAKFSPQENVLEVYVRLTALPDCTLLE
jgi:hypothetical protein